MVTQILRARPGYYRRIYRDRPSLAQLIGNFSMKLWRAAATMSVSADRGLDESVAEERLAPRRLGELERLAPPRLARLVPFLGRDPARVRSVPFCRFQVCKPQKA